MHLEEIWKKRLALLAEAEIFRKKAEILTQEQFRPPVEGKVYHWFAGISSYYDTQGALSDMHRLRFEADKIWAEAVSTAKGNIRIKWDDVKDKGYRCTLETGEVFEP